jgi:hypothetical protein
MASKILPKPLKESSYEEVAALFQYNPKTGVLRWNYDRRKLKKGDPINELNAAGYLTVRVAKKRCLAHRVCWFLHYKKWPAEYLDHIDRNKLNNRISNLREASPAQNAHNASFSKNNKTGLRGVYWCTTRGKFKSQIRSEGKTYDLGEFDTKQEASIAYRVAAKLLHGKFAAR